MSYAHPPAVVVARDDQPFAAGTPDSRVRFLGLGSQTNNDYGLFECHLPAGTNGAGPHYHQGFSESFYILEGRLSVLSGDRRIVASAGDLVYVPRLGIHGFDNASDDQLARFLILFVPGSPREGYFEGLYRLRTQGRAPAVEEIDELARRFDQINIRD
jgi:mannose-6-phosphate isomerase-like protein (cupin superfamily)